MVERHTIFQAELIKQPVLPSQLLTHHDPNPILKPTGVRNHAKQPISTEFCNNLSQKRLFKKF